MISETLSKSVMFSILCVGLITISVTLVSCIDQRERVVVKESNPLYKVLEFALTKVGDEYKMGGTDGKSWDCSSLIQQSYAVIGVMLPRRALEQHNSLKHTVDDPSLLKAGDLLFYMTDASRGLPITHVEMYIGNNKTVEAKGKKYGVVISKLSLKNLVGIKRVIVD